MKKLIYVCCICTGVFFISCQKELSADDGSGVRLPDSTFIEKLFFIDSTATTGDTTRIIDFQYDNERRVSVQNDNRFSNHVNFSRRSVQYHYNGGEMIPYGSSETYRVQNVGTNISSFYYTFDSQGRKIKDSCFMISKENPVPDTIISVMNFRYEGDRIYSNYRRLLFGSAEPPITSNDTSSTDISGNILRISSFSGYQSVQQFTYGIGKNPFRQLNIFSAMNQYAEDWVWIRSYNNIIRLKTTYPGTTASDSDIGFFYDYTTGGRVGRMKSINGMGLKTIVLFTYKTL